MRLALFDKIDDTLALLRKRKEDYQQIRKEVKYILLDVLHDESNMIMDISSRVKTEESLKEKLIRNRFYINYENSEEILNHLSDIIGLKVECRFIDEELLILESLKSHFTTPCSDGYFCFDKYPHVKLDITSQQPQTQRNGFTIYRVDGYYERDNNKINFELQIKSLVNSFWGDIEHKLVYKNTNYYVYDTFMKDILSSINSNLAIVDRQLHIIYDEMENSDRHQMGLVSEQNFEKLLAKAINDLFTEKLKKSIGFTINIKNTSDILGHYLFVKNIKDTLDSEHGANSLFTIFKKMSNIHIDFNQEITMEKEFSPKDAFGDMLGNYLLTQLNTDYEWYVFFQMLFALEPGNNIEDFSLFIEIILDYLVDDYWLKTSFVKLSMEDATKVQEKCIIFLATVLCEVGTIKIIYNHKLKEISSVFTTYMEELEKRVISYHDFFHYETAYYEQLRKEILAIF